MNLRSRKKKALTKTPRAQSFFSSCESMSFSKMEDYPRRPALSSQLNLLLIAIAWKIFLSSYPEFILYALSLADCTSFELMRQSGLDTAFTYDVHFQELGFNMIPERMIS